MVSGTRCLYVSVWRCKVVRGAAAPKEPMTYAVFIWAWRLELGPWSWDLSLEVRIWATWLGFESRDWDLSLKVGIWASRGGRRRRRRRRGRRRNFPCVRKHRSSAPSGPLPKRGKNFITQKRLEAITPKHLQKLYKLLNCIMAVVIEPEGAYIHHLLICNQLKHVIVSINDVSS